MKYFALFLSLTFFGSCVAYNTAYAEAVFVNEHADKDLPELNQKILAYVKKNKGKKILRGECWDVVKMALNESGANWTPPTTFGKAVQLEDVLPGDVVIFENVTFKGELYSQSFGQHYAIVYEVKENGNITLAHQNYNNEKKIRFDDIVPKDKTKGQLGFYRPIE